MIGGKIKEARKAAGITQKELGTAVGKGESTISEWESGKRSPDVELLPVIADCLHTTVAALVGEELPPVVLREMHTVSASEEENRLLRAYRSADPVYKAIALELLINHPTPKKEFRA